MDALPLLPSTEHRGITVTLVHGTWAKRTPWIDPEKSSLCAYLRQQFGDTISFDAFPWDGTNREEARQRGSHALLSLYAAGSNLNQHFFIGHSHGGSVLAYALHNDADFARSVGGVAFLSTPFIQAREASPPVWIWRMLLVVIFALLSTTGILILVVLHHEMGSPNLPGIAIVLSVLLVLALVLAIQAWITRHVKAPLSAMVSASASRIVREVDLSDLRHRDLEEKTLIIRTNGDEASSGMAAAHILTRLLVEIPSQLSYLPTRLKEFVKHCWLKIIAPLERSPQSPKAKLLTASVFFFVLLMTVVVPALSDHLQGHWSILLSGHDLFWKTLFMVYELALYAFFAVACLSAALAVLAVPMIAILSRVAYGRWQLLSSFLIELSVEPTPPGRWQVHQLDLRNKPGENRENSLMYLAHSLSYDDPRTHQIIETWLRARLTETDTGGTRLMPRSACEV
jgi:hypothetical protein